MAMIPFLAMTPAEMQNSPALPSKIAWMSCHFSPCSRGLSNLPGFLPPGSLLILDDQTPICGHDPEQIASQLIQARNSLDISAVLLDFQRPGSEETAELVSYLSAALPCPCSVSEHYAEDSTYPVFLSPAPPSVSLADHLAPWKHREIWLDLGSWEEVLTLTEEGCTTTPLPPRESPREGFGEESLHCHYQVSVTEASAEFTLWRTPEDLSRILEEAEVLGVHSVVGLYQELHPCFA